MLMAGFAGMAELPCKGLGCCRVRVSLAALALSLPACSVACMCLQLRTGREVGLQGQSSWAQLFAHIKPEMKER